MADDAPDFTPVILAAAEWYATRGDGYEMTVRGLGGMGVLVSLSAVTLGSPRPGPGTNRLFGRDALAAPGDLGECVRHTLDHMAAAAIMLFAPVNDRGPGPLG